MVSARKVAIYTASGAMLTGLGGSLIWYAGNTIGGGVGNSIKNLQVQYPMGMNILAAAGTFILLPKLLNQV